LGGVGRKGIFFFFLVPNVIPYWVPLKFPKMFPTAPQIYPIWPAQKFNSHEYRVKRCAVGEYISFYFYFAIGVQRSASTAECSMSQKNDDWPMNMALSPQKKTIRKAVMN
jgi:hypothetical protein